METVDALKQAFRDEPPLSKREKRAMMTRAQALSPFRIVTQVLLVPVVTIALTVSIYVRTSPYEQPDALRHLAALAGCDTAQAMGLAPAMKGHIGYHARNDANGDGVACGAHALANAPKAGDRDLSVPMANSDAGAVLPPRRETTGLLDPEARAITGAKFLTP